MLKEPVGFITMAFGAQRYLDQADALARSLRRHMPGHPICLVTDQVRMTDLYDTQIGIERLDMPGTLLKTMLYDYSPYAETLFIDSDCIAVRPFHDHIAAMQNWDFTPVCDTYLKRGDQDLWLEDVGAALDKLGGEVFPKYNGGVYFFRKSPHAAEVFSRARLLLERQQELGILDFDKAGPGEETLIGLALVEMGATDLYNDAAGLMRTPLNSTGEIEIDPIRGRSHFMKEGRDVSPAIVHFCGDYAAHPTYTIARRMLERGAPLKPLEGKAIHAGWKFDKLRARVRGKLQSMGRPALS